MTNNSSSSTDSKWTGMVPVDGTALAVTDTGGSGIPVVYLNGQFATQGYWRKVITELGPGFRHITYDERARGRSRRSADYSFEAAVRDVDAVLAARGGRSVVGGPMRCAPVTCGSAETEGHTVQNPMIARILHGSVTPAAGGSRWALVGPAVSRILA
ncbi:alpha/beta hydrolase [Nocardia sp. NBC_01730]|uniref:alpha/beta fold hydrolase n=1 Tax=Nocardia sp. NBC_01730 TaxID=2975998 RepID=UPI002E0E8B0C|nr:alpha/beta hydrolase [Nocardia sp. NBC_01730]